MLLEKNAKETLALNAPRKKKATLDSYVTRLLQKCHNPVKNSPILTI